MQIKREPATGTRRGQGQGIIRFVDKNRRPLSALLVFVVLMLIFTLLNPRVFLNPIIYRSIFRTLPIGLILAIPLVFLIVSGEIDLSFGSVVGLGAWAFAATVDAGWNPFLSVVLAIVVGACAGFLNGLHRDPYRAFFAGGNIRDGIFLSRHNFCRYPGEWNLLSPSPGDSDLQDICR